MAVNKTVVVGEVDTESPRAAALRDLLRLLVKAQKALRLYQANNAISDRLEKELYSKLSAQLEEEGSFELTIQEFRILFGEDVLYESTDRNDSLAFLIFRDGIRRLTFLPGLEDNELQGFLRCLNRIGVHSSEQDDLVTLFWEEDFKSINYYAIEELDVESTGPSVQEQLASGALGEDDGGGDADTVSLKDLEQPTAHLPTEACRLGEEEIEALRAELLIQETDAFCLAVPELAIELVLHETSQEARENIGTSLVATLDRLLEEAKLDEVARAVEHLDGLAEMLFSGSTEVSSLRAKVLRELCDSERLGRCLEQVEHTRSLKPAELTAHLARLGRGAVPTLISGMAYMTSSVYRRAVADAIVAVKEEAVEDLTRHLTTDTSAPDITLVREILYIITHLSAEHALPLVEQLLRSSEAPIRREASLALGRFRDQRTATLCLGLVQDKDYEVRSIALDTLVRGNASQLAKAILDQSLANPVFDERSLVEKRRMFAAVAKLGGPAAISWFTALIHPDERRWFASRKEREAIQSAVHGIRMVGTREAQQLLEEMARKGNRFARAASRRELSEGKA